VRSFPSKTFLRCLPSRASKHVFYVSVLRAAPHEHFRFKRKVEWGALHNFERDAECCFAHFSFDLVLLVLL